MPQSDPDGFVGLVDRLERLGVPGRRFWEDDLEMSIEPLLRPALENGTFGEWLGKRSGRQVSMLCAALGIDEDGSVQARKAALSDIGEVALAYLLVESFAKFKSKVAVVGVAKQHLTKAVVEACQKDEAGEDFDTAALLFALFRKDPELLRLVFHVDKIHKTGFARMKLKGDVRSPARALGEALPEKDLRKLLDAFDKTKHDGRRSELKAAVPIDGRFLVFVRRAERPDHIIGAGGLVHGYRPEWIILDFEDRAKRVNISSVSVSVPLEIANRIASTYHGKEVEYDNESEITYAKQIAKLLRSLVPLKQGDLLLVELVVAVSPLEGSAKIKITNDTPIGDAVSHFERGIGGILDRVERLESAKVLFKQKRVSLLFESDGADEQYVVRYSDHRLNASERRVFEDHMRKVHGIPVLSTEKRFKQQGAVA